MADTDFATFLMDLSHGDVNGALSEKLAALTEAVDETGKAGTMTVKITVKKEGTMAVAHADVTVKLPEPPLPGTMFFFSKDGKSLSREDPRQMSLRGLVAPKLKTVGADDGVDDPDETEDE